MPLLYFRQDIGAVMESVEYEAVFVVRWGELSKTFVLTETLKPLQI
jgi:hypothetical protein